MGDDGWPIRIVAIIYVTRFFIFLNNSKMKFREQVM